MLLSFVDAELITSATKHTQSIDYHRKHRKKLFRRRNSTGSVEVMNSHAVNTGHQSIAVGHHRGFSQPSTVNTTGDPWFLQQSAHEMPPTAPARHHKRPAPQPGSILHNNNNNNNNNVGSQSNHQLSQSQHHHSAVNVSIQYAYIKSNLNIQCEFAKIFGKLSSRSISVKCESIAFICHRIE